MLSGGQWQGYFSGTISFLSSHCKSFEVCRNIQYPVYFMNPKLMHREHICRKKVLPEIGLWPCVGARPSAGTVLVTKLYKCSANFIWIMVSNLFDLMASFEMAMRSRGISWHWNGSCRWTPIKHSLLWFIAIWNTDQPPIQCHTGTSILMVTYLEINWINVSEVYLSWLWTAIWCALYKKAFYWRKQTSECFCIHYGDVIMGAIASHITSLTIVYSAVYSDADQRKYQSSASLAFVRGIHRGPVNSPLKWPVSRKMFPLMTSSCLQFVVGEPYKEYGANGMLHVSDTRGNKSVYFRYV